MTSQDNQQYITIELFNSKMETFLAQIRLDNERLRNKLNSKIDSVQSSLHSEIQGVQTSLHSEIQGVQASLHTEIQALSTQVNVNSVKIEMLQHTFYWGFAILALIVAFVPMFRRERKERQQEPALTREKVQEIVREIMSETASNISPARK